MEPNDTEYEDESVACLICMYQDSDQHCPMCVNNCYFRPIDDDPEAFEVIESETDED